MTIYRRIGLGIIGLGVIMFFIGASMFTYRGNIYPVVSKIGEYSFFLVADNNSRDYYNYFGEYRSGS